MWTTSAVRGAMLLATVAWAAAELWGSKGREFDPRARAASTTGLVLALAHVWMAYQFVYAWSHETAIRETARQTAAVTGWLWGGGLFVNYAFLAIWTADVAWWWFSPASRAARPEGVEAARRAIFLFMFVNGAVIFASGIGRAIGVVCVAIAGWAALARRRLVRT